MLLFVMLVYNKEVLYCICGVKLADRVRNTEEVLRLTPGQNAVVSILPIRWTLCKLASIADEDTKSELMSALGYEREKDLQKCFTPIKTVYDEIKRSDMILVNKIYINYTDDVRDNFILDSLQKYGVQVDKVGFNYPASATTFINKWVETATLKRIQGPLERGDINNNNTSMISLSALHFKGNWEFPFDVRDTKETTFRQSPNKVKKVKMMRKMDSVLYYKDNEKDVKLLKLYFGSVGTTLIYAMPSKADGLPPFLEKLSKEPDYFEKNEKKMQYSDLSISIPLMKIKTFVDWTEFIKGTGIKKIFDNKDSGLNSILKPNSTISNIFLNLVKQRTFFELDEMGAYRSMSGLDTGKLRPQTLLPGFSMPEFIADRPYYFVVKLQAENNHYELFNGVFYG
ncbi:hypothetical protein K1T71_005309 [Dendrolimus kikuchii]|uniref:Uncharacterized protein n=1 Tax=Dendrolimus kikuchii TaxID=765133 RepID=A0ACC1D6Y6_9NEOP|nr:hypothetical protein K1T71_005309 [Dendrolimus kikuchii]